MARDFICLWVREARSAIIVDRRTSAANRSAPLGRPVDGCRLVVVQESEVTAETIVWHRLYPIDTPLMIGPCETARISVFDLTGTTKDLDPRADAIADVTTFVLDPTLTIDGHVDGWWVVSQTLGAAADGVDIEDIVFFEPHQLTTATGGDAAGAILSAVSLVERLVAAADRHQPAASPATAYWIVPVEKDRAGAAVLVTSAMDEASVQCTVDFEQTSDEGLQPRLVVQRRVDIAMTAALSKLTLVHWRRNAAAFGLDDLHEFQIAWRGHGPGAAGQEVEVRLAEPVRHGDVFGVMCRDCSLRIAHGDSGGATGSLNGLSGDHVLLFIRRERVAEKIERIETLAELGLDRLLFDVMAAPVPAAFTAIRDRWLARVTRLAYATSCRLPFPTAVHARATIDRLVRHPGTRLDRLFHASAEPHLLEAVADNPGLPPAILQAGMPIETALAGVIWDTAANGALPLVLTKVGRGRASLLRALCHPTTRAQAIALAMAGH